MRAGDGFEPGKGAEGSLPPHVRSPRQVESRERSPGRRRAELALVNPHDVPQQPVGTAVHCADLHVGMRHVRRVQLAPRHERHHHRQSVGWGDDQAAAFVDRHARPVRSAEVSRKHHGPLERRRREDRSRAQRRDQGPALLLRLRRDAERIRGREPFRHEAERIGGEGLRGPGLFPRDVARRDRALFDWKERLAGEAVENEEVTHLGRHGDRRDSRRAAPQREQHRLRWNVIVPQVVMHDLKPPDEPAGGRAQRHDGVGPAVVARARAAVVVGARAAHGDEHQVARRID